MTAKETTAPVEELRRLLNSNWLEETRVPMLYMHEAIHHHRDGAVTVRRWFSPTKGKPCRKRRDNHRMRKALIRQREKGG